MLVAQDGASDFLKAPPDAPAPVPFGMLDPAQKQGTRPPSGFDR
jgi:hypothetical protein